MEQVQAHVAPYKKEVVSNLVKLIKEYPIIGVVNMENLGASALQSMRAKLRKDCVLTMTKRRLIKLAIEETKSSKKERNLQMVVKVPDSEFLQDRHKARR